MTGKDTGRRHARRTTQVVDLPELGDTAHVRLLTSAEESALTSALADANDDVERMALNIAAFLSDESGQQMLTLSDARKVVANREWQTVYRIIEAGCAFQASNRPKIPIPSEICSLCRTTLGEHWIGGLWMYCLHNRTMARRRAVSDAWVIDRNVSMRKAQKHLATGLARMKVYCLEKGLDFEEVSQTLQKLVQGR